MIIAVLDTNVLAAGIAGITTQRSVPGELLRRWRNKAFSLVISEPILTELMRALNSPYFTRRLTASEIKEDLSMLQGDARMQTITAEVSRVAAHAHDDLIIATALSAQAPYLVSGDKQLLARRAYRGSEIVSPRQFLAVLDT